MASIIVMSILALVVVLIIVQLVVVIVGPLDFIRMNPAVFESVGVSVPREIRREVTLELLDLLLNVHDLLHRPRDLLQLTQRH